MTEDGLPIPDFAEEKNDSWHHGPDLDAVTNGELNAKIINEVQRIFTRHTESDVIAADSETDKGQEQRISHERQALKEMLAKRPEIEKLLNLQIKVLGKSVVVMLHRLIRNAERTKNDVDTKRLHDCIRALHIFGVEDIDSLLQHSPVELNEILSNEQLPLQHIWTSISLQMMKEVAVGDGQSIEDVRVSDSHELVVEFNLKSMVDLVRTTQEQGPSNTETHEDVSRLFETLITSLYEQQTTLTDQPGKIHIELHEGDLNKVFEKHKKRSEKREQLSERIQSLTDIAHRTPEEEATLTKLTTELAELQELNAVDLFVQHHKVSLEQVGDPNDRMHLSHLLRLDKPYDYKMLFHGWMGDADLWDYVVGNMMHEHGQVAQTDEADSEVRQALAAFTCLGMHGKNSPDPEKVFQQNPLLDEHIAMQNILMKMLFGRIFGGRDVHWSRNGAACLTESSLKWRMLKKALDREPNSTDLQHIYDIFGSSMEIAHTPATGNAISFFVRRLAKAKPGELISSLLVSTLHWAQTVGIDRLPGVDPLILRPVTRIYTDAKLPGGKLFSILGSMHAENAGGQSPHDKQLSSHERQTAALNRARQTKGMQTKEAPEDEEVIEWMRMTALNNVVITAGLDDGLVNGKRLLDAIDSWNKKSNFNPLTFISEGSGHLVPFAPGMREMPTQLMQQMSPKEFQVFTRIVQEANYRFMKEQNVYSKAQRIERNGDAQGGYTELLEITKQFPSYDEMVKARTQFIKDTIRESFALEDIPQEIRNEFINDLNGKYASLVEWVGQYEVYIPSLERAKIEEHYLSVDNNLLLEKLLILDIPKRAKV
ncbi:MAG: hypothetical protein ACOCXQ_00820 [Patescibacteria group bacterium]